MLFELLGFIIILGAGAYIYLRHKGLAPIAPMFGDDKGLVAAEETADKIRYEMERSADEIINRLAEHIDRLEALIYQAEETSAKLDGRLTRLRREIHAAQESGILPVMTAEQLKQAAMKAEPVEKESFEEEPVDEAADESLGEQIDIQPQTVSTPQPVIYGYRGVAEEMAAAEEEAEEATEFSRLLDSTIAETEAVALEITGKEATTVVLEEPEPEDEPEEYRQEKQPAEPVAAVTEEATPPPRQVKRIDYYARARELKEQIPAYPESGVEAIKPVEGKTVSAAAPVSSVSELTPTEEAKQLLAKGYATEDIARRVHLGRGAIELLRQMGKQGR